MLQGILFSIYVAFVFTEALVARLLIPGNILSTSVDFVIRAVFLVRLLNTRHFTFNLYGLFIESNSIH